MIVAVDIGGSKIRVGYSRIGDHIEDSIDFATPKNQRVVVESIIENIHKLVGISQVDAIGVCSPAPINKTRGTIGAPHNIPWKNLRIVSPLQKHFGCKVAFEHDATAAGIAEARVGAGRNYGVVLYITVSTGIGNSIIVHGKPLPGPNNPESGSMIVAYSPTEIKNFSHATSGRAIEYYYRKSPSMIKDPKHWKTIASELAIGIYNMICIVNPDCVVIGGGVAVHYKRFHKPLLKQLHGFKPLYPLPPIKKAVFVETAPLVGAMLLAADMT
ncbi:MAG: fructokinase [Patescibacteria group bacterium]|nr:fructokinase [Patescibacteria group bacterium]